METKTYEIVDSVEALHGAIARVRAAQKVFARQVWHSQTRSLVSATPWHTSLVLSTTSPTVLQTL